MSVEMRKKLRKKAEVSRRHGFSTAGPKPLVFAAEDGHPGTDIYRRAPTRPMPQTCVAVSCQGLQL